MGFLVNGHGCGDRPVGRVRQVRWKVGLLHVVFGWHDVGW